MTDGELHFQKIYKIFQPRILRYLSRLVGENEAEDLTQEVFVRVDQALKHFRGESTLSTWIYRIATNAAIDRLRIQSFRRTARLELEDESIIGIDSDLDTLTKEKTPSLEESLMLKEMWECLRSFVEELPVNYRTVVVLSDLEEFSNSEIAKILGVSLETVKIRLHRGRSRLRKELETRCGLYRDARNKIAWDGKRP